MGWLIFFIVIAILFPEVILLVGAFIGIVGYGILEFILRLFGKSFDDKDKN